MKNLILTILFLVIAGLVIAQSPIQFNYQAVARDAQGQALKNQAVSLKISLLESSNTGTVKFEEVHQLTSSNLGILNLLIGKGQNQSGFLSNLDWKNKKYWLKVEMDASGGSNYSLMGTTQLVSVPYALHAETATYVDDADADPNNEIQTLSFNTANNELSISNGNKITIPTSGTDADADPLNEIQTLSKNGNTVTLSKNGGSFTDSVNDADADPLNEIQTISKNGNTVTLSKNGGTFTDEVDDADADATNELQSLSFNSSNNELTISNGNTVTIPTGGTDADADPLNEIQILSKNGNTVTLSKNGGTFIDAVDDADADATNEIQTISKNGNIVTLSKNGGTFTDDVNDADADASNELQNLSLSGNNLAISNGNQVDLTPITGPWKNTTYGIIYEANSAVAKITEPNSNGDSLLLFNFGVNTFSSDGGKSCLLGSDLTFINGPTVQATYGYNGIKYSSPINDFLTYSIFNKDSLYLAKREFLTDDWYLEDFTKIFPGSIKMGTPTNYSYFGPSESYLTDGFQKIVHFGIDTFQGSQGGYLNMLNGSGSQYTAFTPYHETGGELAILGTNNSTQFLAAADNCPGGGCVTIRDTLDDNQITMWVTRDTNDVVFGDDDLVSSRGHIYSSWDMFSPTVQSVTDNIVWAEMNNLGFTTEGSLTINTARQLKDEPYALFEPSVLISSGFDKEGTANFYGTNGNLNVAILGNSQNDGTPIGDNNFGSVAVYDSSGYVCAGIEVDNVTGQGIVWADVKNFRVDHPNDVTKNIVYASLEGPEAAAYTRGTATLKNGKVFVEFPEHYRLIANTETMTVILTPQYSKTYGLAVVEKTDEGIWVEELMDGKGNFSFDWEVKCVRKGHEDFKVIRDKPQRRLTSKQQSRKRMTFSKKPSIVPEVGKNR